jgi:hypothetical protein
MKSTIWTKADVVPLVAERHLTIAAATTVAEAIHSANPIYITDEIVRRFEARIARVSGHKKTSR